MEADLWTLMRTNIMRSEPAADLQRIENLVRNGMPDVNGCIRGKEFWCELKYLKSWPSRDGTVVTMPKYRKEQRIWFRRRGTAGATNIFMLIQVDETREYLLLDWKATVYQAGLTVRKILCEQAQLHVQGFFPTMELVCHLRQELVSAKQSI
jgi:hypothetical protein